jgi:hypothetical protein
MPAGPASPSSTRAERYPERPRAAAVSAPKAPCTCAAPRWLRYPAARPSSGTPRLRCQVMRVRWKGVDHRWGIPRSSRPGLSAALDTQFHRAATYPQHRRSSLSPDEQSPDRCKPTSAGDGARLAFAPQPGAPPGADWSPTLLAARYGAGRHLKRARQGSGPRVWFACRFQSRDASGNTPPNLRAESGAPPGRWEANVAAVAEHTTRVRRSRRSARIPWTNPFAADYRDGAARCRMASRVGRWITWAIAIAVMGVLTVLPAQARQLHEPLAPGALRPEHHPAPLTRHSGDHAGSHEVPPLHPGGSVPLHPAHPVPSSH